MHKNLHKMMHQIASVRKMICKIAVMHKMMHNMTCKIEFTCKMMRKIALMHKMMCRIAYMCKMICKMKIYSSKGEYSRSKQHKTFKFHLEAQNLCQIKTLLFSLCVLAMG